MGNEIRVVPIEIKHFIDDYIYQDPSWSPQKFFVEDWQNFAPTQEMDLAQCMRRYPDTVWNNYRTKDGWSKSSVTVTAKQAGTFKGINLVQGDTIVFTFDVTLVS